jgi:hypothetical protein
MNNFPPGRIAVVGNGPSELGRGRGSEIDDHGTIIRLNNYRLGPEHTRDYGERCTHWATTLLADIDHRDPGAHDATYLVLPLLDARWWSRHARHYPPKPQVARAAALAQDGRLRQVPLGWYEALGRASAGVTLLYWLYRERGWSLDGVSLYGFSHFSPSCPHHYWDPTRPADPTHARDREALLVSRMLTGDLP